MYKFFAFIFAMLIHITANATSLAHFYQWAQETDMPYKNAQEALAVNTAQKQQLQSALYPQLSLSANKSFERIPASSDQLNAETTSIGLHLSQNIMDIAALKTWQAAILLQKISKKKLQQAKQELIYKVCQHYLQLAQWIEQAKVLQFQQNLLERQLQQSKHQLQAGTITEAHKLQIQAQADQVKSDRLSLQVKINENRNSLFTMSGRNLSHIYGLKTLNLSWLPRRNLQQWIDLGLEKQPEILQKKLQTQYSKKRMQAADGQHWPTLKLLATASDQQRKGDSVIGRFSGKSLSATLELQLPLYTGGRITAETRKNNALYQQDLTTEQGWLRKIKGDIQAQFTTRKLDWKQRQVNLQWQKSSRAALNAARAKFQTGSLSTVDLLSSILSHYQAKSAFIQSQYQSLTHGLLLLKATGELDEKALLAIDKQLQTTLTLPD
jgi:outer membrane protein